MPPTQIMQYVKGIFWSISNKAVVIFRNSMAEIFSIGASEFIYEIRLAKMYSHFWRGSLLLIIRLEILHFL